MSESSTPTAAPSAALLQAAEHTLRTKVSIRNRRWQLRTFPSCFKGLQAVQLLVDEGVCPSRVDAVEVGQALLDAGVIRHVTKSHPFEDGNYFFQFTEKTKLEPKQKTEAYFKHSINRRMSLTGAEAADRPERCSSAASPALRPGGASGGSGFPSPMSLMHASPGGGGTSDDGGHSDVSSEMFEKLDLDEEWVPQNAVPYSRQVQSGITLLRNPKFNKDFAFTTEERFALNIHGLIPPVFATIEEQAARVMANLERLDDDLDKYIHFMGILERNQRLFYHVLVHNIPKLMPIVYTPTVGLACQRFGLIYQQPRGLWISINDRGRVYSMLRNWPERQVKAIVFTDGERILGLGDLGAKGFGIPLGKLALYTACAGINPKHLLPILIDVGTDNKENLEDPLYIGLRQPRDRSQDYDDLIGEVLHACTRRYGEGTLLQFEDFGNRNALRLLTKYRNKYCVFNDDIQGTASVALAGMYASLRVAGVRAKTHGKGKGGSLNEKLSSQRVLVFGAGSAGLGIANLIARGMVKDEGLTYADARSRIWLVDSRGLILQGRVTGGIGEDKAPFAHSFAPYGTELELKDLAEIVRRLKSTVLIGVSAQPRTFTQEVCEAMASNCLHPLIFPMSNPNDKAECTAEQAYEWTNGRCIFASGSPFAALDVKQPDGTMLHVVPAQGNNAYVFPGIALGIIASRCTRVPEDFFYLAAKRLAELVPVKQLKSGSVYPPLEEIRWVSKEIAVTIATEAFRRGLALRIEPKSVRKLIQSQIFHHNTYDLYVDSTLQASDRDDLGVGDAHERHRRASVDAMHSPAGGPLTRRKLSVLDGFAEEAAEQESAAGHDV